MISINPNQVFELPATPLTPPLPPAKSMYRAYATSETDSDADPSPLNMSSPQVQRISPPKPIIHPRPLVLRSKHSPSSPASVGSISSPPVQFQTPSILSPSPTLVATPPASSPSPRPPIQGARSVPLPNNVASSSTTVTTLIPPPTLSQGRSTRTLTPPTDLSLSPTKSLRQKAFEKAQSPSPPYGHRRQKPSTGQRMKEGVFFALVVLPMSCWYTRGGKMAGPGLGKGHIQLEDDDDDDENDEMDSMDSRAPRFIGPSRPNEENMPPKTPTMTRRMSEDGYRRRNSLSSSNTPTMSRNGSGTSGLARRVSFDGKVTVMRDRSAMDRRDEFERTSSMTRQRGNVSGRRDSFDGKTLVSRERSNTPGRRGSFDGKSPMLRERSNTMGRLGSSERTDSFTREWPNAMDRRQNFDRNGSLTRRDAPQMHLQMQRTSPMSRREWEWEREREYDWRRENASFGGNRIMSMGMPPPVMVAERW